MSNTYKDIFDLLKGWENLRQQEARRGVDWLTGTQAATYYFAHAPIMQTFSHLPPFTGIRNSTLAFAVFALYVHSVSKPVSQYSTSDVSALATFITCYIPGFDVRTADVVGSVSRAVLIISRYQHVYTLEKLRDVHRLVQLLLVAVVDNRNATDIEGKEQQDSMLADSVVDMNDFTNLECGVGWLVRGLQFLHVITFKDMELSPADPIAWEHMVDAMMSVYTGDSFEYSYHDMMLLHTDCFNHAHKRHTTWTESKRKIVPVGDVDDMHIYTAYSLYQLSGVVNIKHLRAYLMDMVINPYDKQQHDFCVNLRFERLAYMLLYEVVKYHMSQNFMDQHFVHIVELQEDYKNLFVRKQPFITCVFRHYVCMLPGHPLSVYRNGGVLKAWWCLCTALGKNIDFPLHIVV